jgi:phytanoyl-CoA hydroxylase
MKGSTPEDVLSALESPEAPAQHRSVVPAPRGAGPTGTPWLDLAYAAIDQHVAGLGSEAHKHGRNLRADLHTWLRDGCVRFPRLLDDDLIGAYLADLQDLWNGRVGAAVTFRTHGGGEKHWEQMAVDELAAPRVEAVDFHNQSMAGKRLACHPAVVDFLGHVFEEQVVLVETFSMIRGGDELSHDESSRAKVASGRLVAGVYVALEDTQLDAGPVGLFPGSHAINLAPAPPGENPEECHYRLERSCSRSGIDRRLLQLDKGDVVVWHGCLVHGGTDPITTGASRLSLLAHFAPMSAYRFDHRAPEETPKRQLVNGALVYGDPRYPELENSLSYPRR